MEIQDAKSKERFDYFTGKGLFSCLISINTMISYLLGKTGVREEGLDSSEIRRLQQNVGTVEPRYSCRASP
jgi:hypothetical protein